jgi:hypothetical protein
MVRHNQSLITSGRAALEAHLARTNGRAFDSASRFMDVNLCATAGF